MRRAHRRRFIGGGLGGPLRDLPQESVARAKARARSGTLNGRPRDSESVIHRSTWEWSTSERRLRRRNDFWGEASEGGRSPPPSFVGALGRTLNVRRVRLACGPRAPPCSWTLLTALGTVPEVRRASPCLSSRR